MSNKKRISKKIREIESKRILRFKIRLNIACVGSSEAVAVLDRVNKILLESILKMNNFQDRIVRACSEYTYGFDVADQIRMNGKTLDFLYEVRKLSGVDDMESKRILADMPEDTRDPLLNLLIVGYELSEAYILVKDTFKF
ncbi:hypothetical protein [Chryseobacterium caseinilyticum]|uniref:Uncharacterized protein n=1 Tax=Chryseobacterium caseinilyticum TaxID=2771428 RepID=A0ABR8Z895_9FLAO|nr:hypothetical protein [Chryseobacterium caseinilyticum]MBD8081145.1 hypothetical protein [Chryseobacterium caseinilyticum]